MPDDTPKQKKSRDVYIHLTLHPERDADVLEWMSLQPRGRMAAALVHALRGGMSAPPPPPPHVAEADSDSLADFLR